MMKVLKVQKKWNPSDKVLSKPTKTKPLKVKQYESQRITCMAFTRASFRRN